MTRAEPVSAPRRTLLSRVFYLARRAWQMEIGIWQSLWRFLTGRRRVPSGAKAFGYVGPVQTVLIVFIVLSAVEIPIIDLIVHPWPWLRIPLLAAGIWGVTWMLGLLLGYITRPHSVGPAGISVRSGPEVDIVVPWADVYSVEIRREHEEKAPKVAPAEDGAGDVLKLWMQDETNLAVRFERPLVVRMPTGYVTVIETRFWADDPRAFLAEARRHL
ncbi:hypothetical protein ASC66_16585 [Leifsonia sp. Root4]|uniref:hypothetical protein n=1 Tax=Leifsonia sp. Root4 TaxID=1736525 RepID=UPI0006FBD557|nr:hypothetical protein [Leifsonia sp. Root4]KQW04070.1 hypothetical protein ASC66_16585 [Leifsonia sp. Root4]